MDRTSNWQQGHFLRRVSFYLSSLQKVRCGGENVESILGFPQSFRGSVLTYCCWSWWHYLRVHFRLVKIPIFCHPFFWHRGNSKFWTLQTWSNKCVARFGSQESGCQGAGGGVATRFVGSQVAGSWWMIRLLAGGEESPVLILGCEGRANEDASCLNKMLIYETCGCVSINSLSVPELCWVLP